MYADGDHIYGSGGGDDLFVGGGVARGGIHFRAGVPAVLCPSICAASGTGENRVEELSAKGNAMLR